MSSSKKRSISKKIILDEQVQINEFRSLPSPTNTATENFVEGAYFGEHINHAELRSDEEICSTSNSSIALSENLRNGEVECLAWSKSSSSCTSESDHLEAEISKTVKQQYNKIEDVLYEKESAINDEYKQWKNNFVYLRVSGGAMKLLPTNGEATVKEQNEETIAEHYNEDIELLSSNRNDPSIKNKIKEAVISSILKDVQTKLIQKQRDHNSYSPISTNYRQAVRLKQNTTLRRTDPKITRSYNETYLQVSSVPLHSSPLNWPQRHNYQSPIMRSHMSASKWQKEPADYSSLPHLVHPHLASATNSSRKAPPYKKFTTPDPRNVTLPPIQNLKLYVRGDGCKSVSPAPVKHSRK